MTALLWGSVFGWLASLGLVLSQRILSLPEAMTAWGEGIKEVKPRLYRTTWPCTDVQQPSPSSRPRDLCRWSNR